MVVRELQIAAVQPDPLQPRTAMDEDRLIALKASLQAKGQLLPIRVRKDPGHPEKYFVVSGHRRLTVVASLGHTTIRCIVVDGQPEESSVLAEQLAENIHRENLNPIDEAESFRRYLSLKSCTAAQAASELQVTPTRISRAMALLDLSDIAKAALRSGQMGADLAYHLSRLPAGEEREKSLQEALAGTLSRDEAARRATKTVSHRRESSAPVSVKRVTCPLPGGRTLTISGAAIQLDGFIELLETTLKEARKARQQGLDVTTLARMFRDQARAGNGGVV
jgi:ParB family chromosome partitioning protein